MGGDIPSPSNSLRKESRGSHRLVYSGHRPLPGVPGPRACHPRRHPSRQLPPQPARVARASSDRRPKRGDHRPRDLLAVHIAAPPEPGGPEGPLAELGILLAPDDALPAREVSPQLEGLAHLVLELMCDDRVLQMPDPGSLLIQPS